MAKEPGQPPLKPDIPVVTQFEKFTIHISKRVTVTKLGKEPVNLTYFTAPPGEDSELIMAETDDPDSILEAFSRKVIARRNLRSLEGKSAEEIGGSGSESDEDENDRPPFEPSTH